MRGSPIRSHGGVRVLLVVLTLFVKAAPLSAQPERALDDVVRIRRNVEIMRQGITTSGRLAVTGVASSQLAPIIGGVALSLAGYTALAYGAIKVIELTELREEIARSRLVEVEQANLDAWLQGELDKLRLAQGPIWRLQFNRSVGRFPNEAETEAYYATYLSNLANEMAAFNAAVAWRNSPTVLPGLRAEAQARTEILQSRVPRNQAGRITVSVGAAIMPDGRLVWIAGLSNAQWASTERWYEAPAWLGGTEPLYDQFAPGYKKGDVERMTGIHAPNQHHAELDVISFAAFLGARLLTIGAGRPHCWDCWEDLNARGIVPAGPRSSRPPRVAPPSSASEPASLVPLSLYFQIVEVTGPPHNRVPSRAEAAATLREILSGDNTRRIDAVAEELRALSYRLRDFLISDGAPPDGYASLGTREMEQQGYSVRFRLFGKER